MKTVKCTLVGDSGVGKASLLRTFTSGEFLENCEPIIFDTFLTHISVDGKSCQLSLWYTNGMEEFNRFRPLSYPGSNIVLICFSLEYRTSFDNVAGKWASEIKEHCPDTPVLLVGLKEDLRQKYLQNRGTVHAKIDTSDPDLIKKSEAESSDADFINTYDGAQLARKLGFLDYIEVSSLTKHNLTALFENAVRNATQIPIVPDAEEPKNVLQSCKGCIVS